MKFSDNQSYYVMTNLLGEVGVRVHDEKSRCDVHIFISREQWEKDLKPKIDEAFEEMESK